MTSPAGKNAKFGNILMCRANSSSWLYLWDKPRYEYVSKYSETSCPLLRGVRYWEVI